MTNRHPLPRFCALCISALFMHGAHSAEAAPEDIGRLFSSPTERAALDLARKKYNKNSPVNTPVSSTPAEQAPVEQITLDGFVRHSSGKVTAWINQTPQHGRENPQGITVLNPDSKQPSMALQLPSGKKLQLKPGQTFEITNGKVSDAYQDPAPASADK